MDRHQLVAVEGAALPFEVELLAAADAGVTRGVRQNLSAAQRALRRKRRGEHRFKGESLQRVARQHGGGLAEHLVVRRLAAAQIVVVHARQIVVDERIGMQQLHAAGDGKRGVNIAAAKAAEFQRQDRPQALAARGETVAHGVEQPRVGLVRGDALCIEKVLDHRAVFLHAEGKQFSFHVLFLRSKGGFDRRAVRAFGQAHDLLLRLVEHFSAGGDELRSLLKELERVG